jgi:hypothetical protein
MADELQKGEGKQEYTLPDVNASSSVTALSYHPVTSWQPNGR